MHLKRILILFFIPQNVLSMLAKKKSFFNNLVELGSEKTDNGKSNGQQRRNCDGREFPGTAFTEPPERQQMVRGEDNEFILQWYDNYESQQQKKAVKMEQDKNGQEKGNESAQQQRPFQFIKVHIKGAKSVTIEAQVVEEEGATAQICLCDHREICDGPFEAVENLWGEIDPKQAQCVRFNYHSLLKLNKMVSKGNRFLLIAQFKLNYDFADAPRAFDREFFLKISYASAENKKTTRVWSVQKSVQFVMLSSLHNAKL